MYPVLFSIGNFTVYSWGFLLAMACLTVMLGAGALFKREGYPSGLVLDLLLATIICGLLGARIGYVLVYQLGEFLTNPLYMFQFDGTGLMWYGGFLGGLLGFGAIIRFKNLNFWEVADMMTPFIALGYAMVRVGCFLSGCCYGKVTDSALGVIFSNVDSYHRWPTQLISSGINVLLFALLIFIWYHRAFIGQVAASYLITYALYRFGIEFLRASEVYFGIFSPGQVISAAIFILGVAAYIYCQRRNRRSFVNKRINRISY